MQDARRMTARERWTLVLFVLAREWVLFTLGVLMTGVSLSALLSIHRRERTSGAALAFLLVAAMGLYMWRRVRRDLLRGQVIEAEVRVQGKATKRQETMTIYYILDATSNQYEVSSEDYERVSQGETYRLVYAPESKIVLKCARESRF